MKIDVARILGIVTVVGIVAVDGCRQKTESKPSKTAGIAERTDVSVLLSRTPSEAVDSMSPILMVWRDPATRRINSRTLPPETAANVAADLVADSRNLRVRVDTQEIAALE